MMKLFRTFAVSTLEPSSQGSTPPMRNVYIPPRPVNPKTWACVGRPSGCAGREAGAGSMRGLRRPSFGCLILLFFYRRLTHWALC
ncbi:hypothetical protein CONPUDRAFT_135405 [Coniophora puteana RWD-64-598 SS2]|uniref:Uncharacterized protein n=1 Tax=Coniophora puteana (strain RWD-64-598) TaxID=741705 RepID=A0A5M3MXS8_CONPW|nr:uncharacterized protein CONPUDRAFT_135405 [Coniophora puteana RWD-64-598 SS2]EIW83584.1 hypothetical protein CONPUDRAFT_135405 [Coniophora puteana RWD-64-598 SS2]